MYETCSTRSCHETLSQSEYNNEALHRIDILVPLSVNAKFKKRSTWRTFRRTLEHGSRIKNPTCYGSANEISHLRSRITDTICERNLLTFPPPHLDAEERQGRRGVERSRSRSQVWTFDAAGTHASRKIARVLPTVSCNFLIIFLYEEGSNAVRQITWDDAIDRDRSSKSNDVCQWDDVPRLSQDHEAACRPFSFIDSESDFSLKTRFCLISSTCITVDHERHVSRFPAFSTMINDSRLALVGVASSRMRSQRAVCIAACMNVSVSERPTGRTRRSCTLTHTGACRCDIRDYLGLISI